MLNPLSHPGAVDTIARGWVVGGCARPGHVRVRHRGHNRGLVRGPAGIVRHARPVADHLQQELALLSGQLAAGDSLTSGVLTGIAPGAREGRFWIYLF